MSFSLEYPGVAVAHVLRRVARLLRPLITWAIFSDFLSSPPQTSSSRPSRASAKAIRDALRVSTFADLHPSPCAYETCAVCLADMLPHDEVRELRGCRHVFHKGCLDRWLDHDDRGTCPLCRVPLLVQSPPPPAAPSWEVERLLYLFGDDLALPTPSSYAL